MGALYTFPASCFVVWICLVLFGVPPLLNSARLIPTYVGFYIQYPNPSLIGAVQNLRCRTNGLVADGFSYSCRFNVKPSNVEQFVRQMELSSTTSNYCVQRLSERGQELSETSWFPSEDWWKPLDLELIHKVNLKQLIASPSVAARSHKSSLHSPPSTLHNLCSSAEIDSASQTSAPQSTASAIAQSGAKFAQSLRLAHPLHKLVERH